MENIDKLLQALGSIGIVLSYSVYSLQCIVIETKKKLDSVALALSNRLHEGFFVFGAISIAWMRGSSVIYIVESKWIPEIEDARRIYRLFTEREDAPYSISSCSRKMLKEIEIPSGYGKSEEMLQATGWHCLIATPGKYEDLSLIDLKGAYWQIARKARTPVVSITNSGNVSFNYLKTKELEKWLKLLDLIKDNKTMRNGFIGSLASAKSRIFSKGKYEVRKLPKHKLHHFAHLVVATCYEITSEAAISVDSKYSHTDCVAASKVPQIFDDLQLEYSQKASGPSEVIAIGNRKIGNDKSEFYKAQEEGILFDAKAIKTQYHGLKYCRWLVK